jgi:hypothetical protein
MSSVTFAIADLPGATLGLATPRTIKLDVNAAGYGWFVDPTPLDDTEFSPSYRLFTRDSRLHIDLLTTVMHELGNSLGYNDLDPTSHPNDLMSATLAPGVRRTAFVTAVDTIFAGSSWTK